MQRQSGVWGWITLDPYCVGSPLVELCVPRLGEDRRGSALVQAWEIRIVQVGEQPGVNANAL